MKIGKKAKTAIYVFVALLVVLPLLVYGVLQVTRFTNKAATAPAWPTKTVCSSGCDFSSIKGLQDYLDGYSETDGLRIIIKEGTYSSNLGTTTNAPIRCMGEWSETGKVALYIKNKVNVSIEGEGASKTVIDLRGQFDSGILVWGGSGISIKNLAIKNGKVQDNCAAGGIMLSKEGNADEISGVKVSGMTHAGEHGYSNGINIHGSGTEVGNISNNNLEGNGSHGIHIYGSGTEVGNISNNTLEGNGTQGIIVYGEAKAGDITGNVSKGNGVVGINIQGSGTEVGNISNNTLEGNGTQGIIVCDDAKAGDITGNVSKGSGTDGIYITGDQTVARNISNNTIVSNGRDGLLISSGTTENVVNNIFYANAEYGIHKGDTAQTGTIKYNNSYANTENWKGFEPGEGNISEDPKLDYDPATGLGTMRPKAGKWGNLCGDGKDRPWGTLVSGQKGECSPVLSAGDPAIKNPGGIRSDMGAWGGPQADWPPYAQSLTLTGHDACRMDSSGNIVSDVINTGKAWDDNVSANQQLVPIEMRAYFTRNYDVFIPVGGTMTAGFDLDYSLNLKNNVSPEAKSFLMENNGEVIVYVFAINEDNQGNQREWFLDTPMLDTATIFWVNCSTGSGDNQSPVISAPKEGDLVQVGVSESVRITVVASDPDGDPLTYAVESQVGWLEWDSISHAFTGTAPGQPGSPQGITVTVSDGKGGTATVSFSVQVIGGAGTNTFRVKIDYPDRDDNTSDNVDVKVFGWQTNVITSTNAEGVSNSILTDSLGEHTVWVKTYGYLAKSVTVNISASGQIIDIGSVIGGDCNVEGNSYNYLNIADYLTFVKEYNATVFNCCDYNRNGAINTQDYILFGKYYRTAREGGKEGRGDTPPF